MEANRTLDADVNQPTWAARLCRAVAAPLLLWLLVALPAAVQAQFTYTTNNNQITITRYTGIGRALITLIIPDTINDLPVTSIGSHAFSGRTNVTGVTIPNSVTTIGDKAFYFCLGLTNVTIPNGVISIGEGAFEYCASLANLTLPNGVNTISYYAFYGCRSLTSVTIPSSSWKKSV